MTNFFKKIDKLMIVLQENLCAALFLFLFIMCLLQIVFRNFFGLPAPWTEEFARVGLIYLTFFGAAIGLRNRAHPSVDFLVSKLPLRIGKALDIIAELLVMSVSLVFVIYGSKYIIRMWNDHSTVYYYSKSFWYFGMPLAGFLMIIYGIRNVFLDIESIVINKDLTEGEATNE